MPQPPNDVWLAFAGVLDLHIARALVAELNNALVAGVERVHLLLQSPGGSVNEGVFLFNYFNALPIEILAYYCGFIGSAAATRTLVPRNGSLAQTRPSSSTNPGPSPATQAPQRKWQQRQTV